VSTHVATLNRRAVPALKWSRWRAKLPVPTLPLVASLGDKYDLQHVPDTIKKGPGYREVLEAALDYGEKALTEFRAIRDRYINRSNQTRHASIAGNTHWQWHSPPYDGSTCLNRLKKTIQ